MVFLFAFLIIMIAIITIRIKFELEDFKFKSQNKEHINKNYKINIVIYIFQILPILKLKINNKKMQELMNDEKIRKVIKKQEIKIIGNKKDIDFKILKQLKNIKIDIKEMRLKLEIGTEDASITAFTIPIISTLLAIFLSKKVKKYNEKQIFLVQPIYNNQNLINIEISGIFQIKMIHIINTICIVNKKRKGDKNERTSNRRSYDYGYE